MAAEAPRQPLLLINVVGLTPGLLGAATPRINQLLLKTAQMASLQPVFPAVTSTVQASILTGAVGWSAWACRRRYRSRAGRCSTPLNWA